MPTIRVPSRAKRSVSLPRPVLNPDTGDHESTVLFDENGEADVSPVVLDELRAVLPFEIFDVEFGDVVPDDEEEASDSEEE